MYPTNTRSGKKRKCQPCSANPSSSQTRYKNTKRQRWELSSILCTKYSRDCTPFPLHPQKDPYATKQQRIMKHEQARETRKKKEEKNASFEALTCHFETTAAGCVGAGVAAQSMPKTSRKLRTGSRKREMRWVCSLEEETPSTAALVEGHI